MNLQYTHTHTHINVERFKSVINRGSLIIIITDVETIRNTIFKVNAKSAARDDKILHEYISRRVYEN